MHRKVISQISFEIGQEDRLFESYSALLEKVKTETPDLVEITALASVLHSFILVWKIFSYASPGELMGISPKVLTGIGIYLLK